MILLTTFDCWALALLMAFAGFCCGAAFVEWLRCREMDRQADEMIANRAAESHFLSEQAEMKARAAEFGPIDPQHGIDFGDIRQALEGLK